MNKLVQYIGTEGAIGRRDYLMVVLSALFWVFMMYEAFHISQGLSHYYAYLLLLICGGTVLAGATLFYSRLVLLVTVNLPLMIIWDSIRHHRVYTDLQTIAFVVLPSAISVVLIRRLVHEYRETRRA